MRRAGRRRCREAERGLVWHETDVPQRPWWIRDLSTVEGMTPQIVHDLASFDLRRVV
jgi:hypothetical protein